MIRIVRTAEGAVVADVTGRLAGRGTYLCPVRDCWTQAIRTGSLARVLKTEVREPDRVELERSSQQYSETRPAD